MILFIDHALHSIKINAFFDWQLHNYVWLIKNNTGVGLSPLQVVYGLVASQGFWGGGRGSIEMLKVACDTIVTVIILQQRSMHCGSKFTTWQREIASRKTSAIVTLDGNGWRAFNELEKRNHLFLDWSVNCFHDFCPSPLYIYNDLNCIFLTVTYIGHLLFT